MATFTDRQADAIVDLRPTKMMRFGNLGQGNQDIEHGNAVGDRLERRIMRRDLLAHPRQQRRFEFLHQALGIEHLGFVLFELRSDVTLAVGDRLLADVIARHGS